MIIVATYHKTGTVWMLRTFQGIANLLNRKLYRMQQSYAPGADIYFAHKSWLPAELLGHDFRGLHVIRDPRDVVLSGMHYHKRAREPWLHAPREDLRGGTYQETLLALPPDEQLYFEMDRVGRLTVSQMLDWSYEDNRFFEAKYEDLISPNGTELFRQILTFLRIDGSDVERCLAVFERNSLQRAGFVANPGDTHVRSGRPQQWRAEFRRRHGERFLESLGDCLVRLGYERDDRWIEQLAD